MAQRIDRPPADLAGIGITGQQHGVVLVDQSLVPLTPLINWQDRRATDILPGTDRTLIRQAIELLGDDAPQRAGCRLAAGYMVTAEYVADLNMACASARTVAGQIVAAKRSKKGTTKSEASSLTALLQTLRDFQKRAKRKFGKDAQKLAAYRIGKDNFGDNRTELEQDAAVIIDLAVADALPGSTPEKIAAARQQLAAWKGADQVQTGAEGAQSELRRQLQSQVADINQARRNIQFAADTLWPHTDRNNAPIRKSFKLPTNRPMH